MPKAQKTHKISMMTSPFLDSWGHDKTFQVFQSAGFTAVDYTIPQPWRLHNKPEGIYFEDEAVFDRYIHLIKESAEKHGIEIHQMHAPFGMIAPDPTSDEDYMHVLERVFRAAKILDCRYVVVHPAFFYYDVGVSKEDEWEMNKTFFSALLDDLQRYDVVCCLENMCVRFNRMLINACCGNPHEARLYVDRLNEMAGETDRFAFCLDTGHALITRHELREYVKILGERMTTLHINDNNGQNDLHRMPYTGVGDWERFLEALKEVNYQGVLNFESFGPYPEPLWEAAIHFQGEIGKAFANQLKA